MLLHLSNSSNIAWCFTLSSTFLFSSCTSSSFSSSNFLFLFFRCLRHASACRRSLLSSLLSPWTSPTSCVGDSGETDDEEEEEERELYPRSSGRASKGSWRFSVTTSNTT